MSCLDNVYGDCITGRHLCLPYHQIRTCATDFYLSDTVHYIAHICNHHSEDDLKKSIYDVVSSAAPAKL